jgi:hypothetical protein
VHLLETLKKQVQLQMLSTMLIQYEVCEAWFCSQCRKEVLMIAGSWRKARVCESRVLIIDTSLDFSAHRGEDALFLS